MALAVGCFQLGQASLWFDEAFSAQLVNKPLADFARTIYDYEGNQSLYFVLLRLWPWNDGAEAALRLPSVLCTALAAPMLYGLGQDLFDRATGMLAALVFLLVPSSLHATQEARGYALFSLMAVASTWAFVRATREGGMGHWIIYAASVTALAYSHTYGAFVVLAHLVAVQMWWPRRRSLALTLGACMVLLCPLMLLLSNRGGTALSFLHEVTTDTLRLSAIEFGGRLGMALLLAALALAGSVVAACRHRTVATLVIGWMLLTPALTLSYSLAVTPVFSARYMAGALPALALLCALALRHLPVRLTLALPVVGALLVALVLNLRGNTGPLHREDWRSAVAVVNEGWQPDDQVLPALSHERDGINQYRESHLPAATENTTPRVGRFWMVSRFAPAVPARARLLRHEQFEGVQVNLYELPH